MAIYDLDGFQTLIGTSEPRDANRVNSLVDKFQTLIGTSEPGSGAPGPRLALQVSNPHRYF